MNERQYFFMEARERAKREASFLEEDALFMFKEAGEIISEVKKALFKDKRTRHYFIRKQEKRKRHFSGRRYMVYV